MKEEEEGFFLPSSSYCTKIERKLFFFITFLWLFSSSSKYEAKISLINAFSHTRNRRIRRKRGKGKKIERLKKEQEKERKKERRLKGRRRRTSKRRRKREGEREENRKREGIRRRRVSYF